MLSREVPRGYRDVGRRPGCNGGGRREGGPACSGRAIGSRGSPRRTTVRGRPDCDTPRDGAAGASASTVDAAGTGASATHGAGAGDGAGAGASASAGLTRFLWRQRE